MEKVKEDKKNLPNFFEKLSLKQRDHLKIKIPENNTEKIYNYLYIKYLNKS